MKIIDRLEILKKFINLNKNEFLFIQIIKRRKDNPDLKFSEVMMKSFYVNSINDIIKYIPRIEEICDKENARAYVRLNPQDYTEASIRCIEYIAENIRKGTSNKNYRAWDSICGKKRLDKSLTYRVIDLDSEHLHLKSEILLKLEEFFSSKKLDPKDCYIINPTKTGSHIITKRFDKRIIGSINEELSEKGIPNIKVMEDCTTLLYLYDEQKVI